MSPNHALQRTALVRPPCFVLSSVGLSLSLASLDPESLQGWSSMARWFLFSAVERVPVRLPARSSFRPVRSFVRAFPAAAPFIPPPESMFFSSGGQRALCRRGPNHALQRTAGACPSFFGSLSGPPSLSLSPLGPESLFFVGEWHAGSRSPSHFRPRSGHPVSTPILRVHRSLRSSLPGGSTPHSPAGVHAGSRSVRSVGAGLTTRSSERRPARGVFSAFHPCSAGLRR